MKDFRRYGDKRIFRCPDCRSRKTTWLGWIETRGGKKHRRKCQGCGKTWQIEDSGGFDTKGVVGCSSGGVERVGGMDTIKFSEDPVDDRYLHMDSDIRVVFGAIREGNELTVQEVFERLGGKYPIGDVDDAIDWLCKGKELVAGSDGKFKRYVDMRNNTEERSAEYQEGYDHGYAEGLAANWYDEKVVQLGKEEALCRQRYYEKKHGVISE